MSGMSGIEAFLKSIDVFPKTLDEFKERTFSGATISVVSVISIVALIIGEFNYYHGIDRVDELYVDTRPEGLLDIYLNITFPNVACDVLTLDVMDGFGESQVNVEHNIHKRRLDRQGNELNSAQKETRIGHETDEEVAQVKDALEKKKEENYCGSCYGAESVEGQCCNTCDDVKNAYRTKGWALSTHTHVEQCVRERVERQVRANSEEGCHLYGSLQVNKVQGNFHFAPGKSFQHAGNHSLFTNSCPLKWTISMQAISSTILDLGLNTRGLSTLWTGESSCSRKISQDCSSISSRSSLRCLIIMEATRSAPISIP